MFSDHSEQSLRVIYIEHILEPPSFFPFLSQNTVQYNSVQPSAFPICNVLS